MQEGSGVVDDESFYRHTAVLISNRGKRIRAFLRLRSLFIHKQRTVQDFRTTRQSEPNGTPGTSLQSSCSANSIALTLHWRGCAFPQLERSRFAQCFLHTGPTLRTGSFGSSGSAPVSFQANRVAISIPFEGGKLSCPVDDALAYGCPVVVFSLLDYIFAVAVPDSIFGQQVVCVGIRYFPATGGVARIPIKHKETRSHTSQNSGRFRSGCGVAGRFVLQKQDDATLAGFFRNLLQSVVHCVPVGTLVFQSPEIETAHTIGTKTLGQRDAAFQNFILLSVGEAGFKLIPLFAVL